MDRPAGSAAGADGDRRRAPGRSQAYWLGPALGAGCAFDLHVALHPGMGPGGIMYRAAAERRSTSFTGASATGVEGQDWPEH